MKLLPVLLISIQLVMFASLASLTPSLFIFVAVCLSICLYFDVIAFCKRQFDVLSDAVKVFFDDRSSLISLASLAWNLYLFLEL